jgi:Ca2+-binding EF-hand superfamily protein
MTFDTDKDGFISAQEFKFMLGILKGQEPTLSPGTFEEFLLQADTDKDGRVSVEELKAWLQKKT